MNEENHDYTRLAQNDLMKTLQTKEAEATSDKNLTRNKRINYLCCFLLLKLSWIVVFAIILSKEGNCTQPIRLWMEILMYFFIANIGVALLRKTSKFPSFFIWLQVVFYLLEFIWSLIGSFWFFKDNDCENDWFSGYIVSFIFVVFFFISLIPVCCFCCVMISMPLVSRIRLDILK